MGLVKDMKNKFREMFHSSEKPVEIQREKEKFPGTQETRKDVGKEVFEKTGRIHEGVGQSSTRVHRQNVIPQDFPIKKHGLRSKESEFKRKQDRSQEKSE